MYIDNSINVLNTLHNLPSFINLQIVFSQNQENPAYPPLTIQNNVL